jgi:hypothetical protein
MKISKCSRRWLAEAIRDGRVKGPEREGFERHAVTCADCAAEVETLEHLGAALRQLPTKQQDHLSNRRQRQKLMADVDSAWLAGVKTRLWRNRAALWTGGVAVAGFVALYGLWLRQGSLRFEPRPIAAESVVDVRAELGARWSQSKGDDFNRVDLIEGALWLRIQRARSESRVVIGVPDGEIEDFGTVLTVRVADSRTTSVVVKEGHVALRLRDLPEVQLHAGESWTAPPEVTPPPVAPEPSPVGLGLTASIGSHSAPKGAHETSKDTASPRRDPKRTTQPIPAEIEAGNAEDRAYVEIIDLVRAGKTTAARAAARDYLVRFPDGFRRIEVRDVATGRTIPH